ncbi:transcription factor [Scheffersomyces amazonensis]|uniref:transcription factor n=1 Tax=Scheffersomyces amazonensis TaxID=1078765 RepID=UPI00315CA4D7
MPKNDIAEEHSMDIPHVTAVELPLIVKNVDKAISMIGGKQRISEVINSHDKSSNLTSHTTLENTLELRLRNDPFHHPIQSSYNTSEKILVKVSVPKKGLPKDYYDDPSRYSVKELLEINAATENTPTHRTQPVAIIDKTYSFKSIADFQVSTKNNSVVQDFNNSILESKNFETLRQYFDNKNHFNAMDDFNDTSKEYFKDIDHQLPPPPILSPIRFPFDFRYQKNPFTTAVKDAESGEIRVVSTKNSVKLYTKMIDYNFNIVPDKPAVELIDSLSQLTSKAYPVNSPEYLLLKCINWTRDIFDLKPIWLRKQLEDIVPEDIRRYVKQALPYVTFIYKSGPWRFCNVKFGVDPKSDKSFWIYQSEYFRIPGLRFVVPKENTRRMVPNTIIEANKKNKTNQEIEVSEYLFFNGVTLPSTVTYQIGDIVDLDITTIIENHRKYFGRDFLRDIPDFQDGWINRQTMEVIRRIIRYKLNRIVREESTDQNKIYKIINTDYTANEDQVMEGDEENGKNAEQTVGKDTDNGNDNENENENEIGDTNDNDNEEEAEDDDDVDVGVDEEAINQEPTPLVDEANIMHKLDQMNEDASSKLSQLVGFIKQDIIHE